MSVHPLGGLRPQERANWEALVTKSPRFIAKRLHMSVKDAACIQAFGRCVLVVHQRMHEGRPFEDLERKANALIDEMSPELRRFLYEDDQIQRIHKDRGVIVVRP